MVYPVHEETRVHIKSTNQGSCISNAMDGSEDDILYAHRFKERKIRMRKKRSMTPLTLMRIQYPKMIGSVWKNTILMMR